MAVTPPRTVLRSVTSLAGVGVVTASYVWLAPVNPTTVALTYLLGIVVIATAWGLGPATTSAVAAVVCFNAFFLPPVGTLTIADTQNWVSFFAFLATAIIVSQLSGRARDRRLEALARQRDLERLYALSRSLLLAEVDAGRLASTMATRIADVFDLAFVGVLDLRREDLAWGGPGPQPDVSALLRTVADTGETRRHQEALVVPIRLGSAPIGALAVSEPVPADAVLQSIVNLAAIALERARTQEAVASAEAARQSGELRAALLDAVAHDLKTPLTAGKAAASALRAGGGDPSEDRELVAIVDDALDRLQRLIDDALHTLRIEAGDVVLRRARYHVATLVRDALREFASVSDSHPVEVDVPADGAVEVDGPLIRLALRQLFDNAFKYSPPDAPIRVVAEVGNDLRVSVWNAGSVIPSTERARVFDRFFRGGGARTVPGSGLGLSIVRQIARAHGGDAGVDVDQHGVTVTMRLPGAAHPAGAPTNGGNR